MEHFRTRVSIHRNGPTEARKTYSYDTVRNVDDTTDGLVAEMQALGDRYIAVVGGGPTEDRATLIPFHSISTVDVYAVPLDADPAP